LRTFYCGSVARFLVKTFDKKFDDDILKRAAEYKGVFETGLKMQDKLKIFCSL